MIIQSQSQVFTRNSMTLCKPIKESPSKVQVRLIGVSHSRRKVVKMIQWIHTLACHPSQYPESGTSVAVNINSVFTRRSDELIVRVRVTGPRTLIGRIGDVHITTRQTATATPTPCATTNVLVDVIRSLTYENRAPIIVFGTLRLAYNYYVAIFCARILRFN